MVNLRPIPLRRIGAGLVRRLGAASTVPARCLYTLGIRSPGGLCVPDFLGIGAQRAGTTWLYENLRHHPELYLPEPKELHYFDWNVHQSLGSYCAKFQPGRGKVKGEITPGYSIIPSGRIRFIRAIMPNVRLLFMMRNPVARAWSQAIMNLMRLRRRTFEELSDAELFAHFRASASVKRGDYQTILTKWLTVFPREQLYIGFFEDIAARPQELLRDIFTHLGVSRDVDWHSFPFNKVFNQNAEMAMPEKYRAFLEEMYATDILALHDQFGDRVAGWLRR